MEAKIIYTDSGKKEMYAFQKNQKEILEKYIIREKYVIGDNEVEITASDIVRVKEQITINYSRNRILRPNTLKLASYLYTILGIGMVLIGFTYEYIKELLMYNKEQALFIITGASLTVFGVLLAVMLKYKEKQQREIRRKRLIDEFEKEELKCNI